VILDAGLDNANASIARFIDASIGTLANDMIRANASIDALQSNMVNANASITAIGVNNPVLKESDYQIITSDNFIVASGNVTLKLASASEKHRIKAVNRSIDTNASIRIIKTGGDTIQGATNITMKNKYDSVVLIGDGANTHIQF